MARHIITEKEMTDYLNAEAWHKAACSFGNGSSKSLEVSTDKTFRVKDSSRTVYIGKDLAEAVAAYNDTP